MPWCPKCKTEYREGFTVCADCGSGLVAEQPPEEPKTKESFVGYEETDLPETETHEEPEEESGDGEKKRKKDSGSKKSSYQDSSERASENRSSAWILLALGILGLTAIVLCAVGVIPMRMGNPYLFYGVMGAVFVLFVVAGVVSMKNARFFDMKAESENSLRNTLQEWCRENLDAAEIDGRIGAQGLSEEILYFRRFSYIKQKMNHQFVNLDQSFLDSFIDEYVYEQVFEQGS